MTPYSVRTTQRREVYSEKRIGRNRLNRTGLSIPFPTLPQRVCTDESASHLKIFIPKIEKAELDLLVSELKDQYIGIAFDGTSRLGEAINVTARWCSADFEIVMRFEDAVKTQLPQYLAAAANAPSFDKGSVADYSDAILSWWRDNGTAFPALLGTCGARRLRNLAQLSLLRARLLPAEEPFRRGADECTG